MATLDDKLMGEKLHYYCSSSEDEDDAPKFVKEGDEVVPLQNPGPRANQANTGPKGVIEDARRYKQLEAEKRAENEKERLALAKKIGFDLSFRKRRSRNQKRNGSFRIRRRG